MTVQQKRQRTTNCFNREMNDAPIATKVSIQSDSDNIVYLNQPEKTQKKYRFPDTITRTQKKQCIVHRQKILFLSFNAPWIIDHDI